MKWNSPLQFIFHIHSFVHIKNFGNCRQCNLDLNFLFDSVTVSAFDSIFSWLHAVFEKLIITVKKYPISYGTQRFTTMFTRTHHWSLSWARWIQPIVSHPLFLGSILILSYPHIGLTGDLFPSYFLTQIWYAFLISPDCATCPIHLILWFDHPNNIWRI
jgi:hypothetical protein